MADIIINGIPEESINSIRVGDKEFIAAAPIPDFYAQVTPEVPSVELNGNYVNGRVDAAHGVKEIPILPSTSIQKVKPEGYYWDEVEIAPAQMIYDNAPSEVAGPNDVKLGKWFLSQNGIEQGTYFTSLMDKVIRENGTYIADDDKADGYHSVQVEVPGQLDDLTGTCWIFKDNVNVSDLVGGVSAYSNRNYNINFITDDDKGEFEHIYLESTHAYGDTFKYGNGLRLSKYISVYDSHSGWNQMNQRWRPIRITGGSDATNKYLIAWLLTNAVRV